MDISASFAVTLTTIKQPVAGALYPTNFSHLLCQFLYRQIHHLKWNAIDFPCVQTPVSSATSQHPPARHRYSKGRLSDGLKMQERSLAKLTPCKCAPPYMIHNISLRFTSTAHIHMPRQNALCAHIRTRSLERGAKKDALSISSQVCVKPVAMFWH